ncbi:nicotinate-nucleotide-dimethylbenzimidazole phosphoribosyltransferase [Acetitomaculum ruminis DSM 5522]|uniref:Nicotinate-nucleotide--dimethylbenzimidazole phosphoribosyltransferase n=1 Tax=Acetitomaculum ruminis DSM 5522 TaxID=1120918 RepID=A0A1I0WV61_9FIRM|nr:nicotinate-nucleotide--dimethylbenzimidazole phosphoribosyltransferase [Acetitomaculum ruminis]SFA92629.1 nicotinate-nucleotide-dimethylbenzimidazole phosphoribosyltransferase [Acetitomaculum ruminis DSM 5522]
MTLEETLEKIEPINKEAYLASKKHWDDIAKPLHSLGKLEDSIMQIAAINGNVKVNLDKKGLIIMCADNGVVEEGVTQTDNSVTAIVAENFLDCATSVAVMCKELNVDLFPMDVGMVKDTRVDHSQKKVYGTKNFTKEAAMTRQVCISAIETGINKVLELSQKGYKIIATGEMGIGNTTTSSAVATVLLGVEASKVTGKGSGLTTEGLNKKIKAIEKGIELNKPDKNDPIDVISKVGGLDIAGLCGVFLGCAALKIPCIIDGFISSVAALCAVLLKKEANDYILASHVSKEPAGRMMLDKLEKDPIITANMCLGEGTGAVALYPLLDLSLAVYNSMSTFSDIEIEAYKPL